MNKWTGGIFPCLKHGKTAPYSYKEGSLVKNGEKERMHPRYDNLEDEKNA